MLCSSLARRALMGATACSVSLLPVLLFVSPVHADTPNPSACKGLYRGDPPGSLAMTTNPPTGTVLHPGDTVEVTATWNTADWPRPVLHKVLDCLLVNGEVDYGQSTQEKPTDNDGLYRYSFTVPGRAVGGQICDRVRLSGRFVKGGELVVQKSNTICFSVTAAGGTGSTGSTAPPVEISTQAVAPPVPPPAAPLVPAPPVPEVAAPELELSSAQVPMLPRTGRETLALARLGGLLVALGATVLATRVALRSA